MLEPQEKPLGWAFRKKHKTHFKDRHSRSSYQPKTNTPTLYDGSALSRRILTNAIASIKVGLTPREVALGQTILIHALDYLKGKDIRNNFSYTQEFFTNLGDWVEAMQDSQKPELLSITPVGNSVGVNLSPTETAEDYPEWNPNHEPKTPTT